MVEDHESEREEQEVIAESEGKGCSAREQYLCILYVLYGDLKLAAEHAGYASRDSALVRLYDPPVAAYLQRIRTSDLKLAAERLAMRLQWLTDATVFDALEPSGDGGLKLKDPEALSRGEKYAIKKIRLDPKVSRAGDIVGHAITIEMEDRLRAMEIAAKLQESLARWVRTVPDAELKKLDEEEDGVIFRGGIPLIGRELEVGEYMTASGVPQARRELEKQEGPDVAGDS